MYGVDLDQLDDTVASLSRCEAALDDLLDEVSRHVDRLHELWAGDAAAAQAAAQESWEAGFRSMRDGLAAMRAAGNAADTSYRAAVDTNRRMWEQV